MAVASQSPSSTPPDEHRASSRRALAGPATAEPRLAFRAALGRYKGARLTAIRLAQGFRPDTERIRPAGTAEEITEYLDQPAAVDAMAARLPIGSRLALSLFAVTESTSMSLAGLSHALGVLGADPTAAIVRLLEPVAGDRADPGWSGSISIRPERRARRPLSNHPARIPIDRPEAAWHCLPAVRSSSAGPRVGRIEPILRLSACGSGWEPSRCVRPGRPCCTARPGTDRE
jgi:hypothetical protein